ncbi:cytochrome P450 [Cyathus striatus]|nr:cytochrome P450 [Cyathus striatus]
MTSPLDPNLKCYQDPHEFRPSRWYNISAESESFVGFGIGPRACIGRKFTILESIYFLTVLLKDYKIEPLLSSGKALDTWVREVFDAKCLIALAINKVPVRFVRRTK